MLPGVREFLPKSSLLDEPDTQKAPSDNLREPTAQAPLEQYKEFLRNCSLIKVDPY